MAAAGWRARSGLRPAQPAPRFPAKPSHESNWPRWRLGVTRVPLTGLTGRAARALGPDCRSDTTSAQEHQLPTAQTAGAAQEAHRMARHTRPASEMRCGSRSEDWLAQARRHPPVEAPRSRPFAADAIRARGASLAVRAPQARFGPGQRSALAPSVECIEAQGSAPRARGEASSARAGPRHGPVGPARDRPHRKAGHEVRRSAPAPVGASPLGLTRRTTRPAAGRRKNRTPERSRLAV